MHMNKDEDEWKLLNGDSKIETINIWPTKIRGRHIYKIDLFRRLLGHPLSTKGQRHPAGRPPLAERTDKQPQLSSSSSSGSVK